MNKQFFTVILAVLLGAGPVWSWGERAGTGLNGAPAIKLAQVWYYPEAMLKPMLMVSVGRKTMENPLVFPGGAHRFRIRVETVGGIQHRGERTVWVRIVFRDSRGGLYQLPEHRWRARGGVKDVYFEIPETFPAGSVECRIDLLAGDPSQPRGRRIVESTGFLRLGRTEL
ncbi:MAG: hypothetical protein HY319_19135 [Armatimonadetes bacterium]|nr:hypothetical protein [Armatimonadota bacterium]